MALARRPRMTTDEFLAWEARQPEKFELVDGVPRMMAGGSRAHALIAANLIRAIGNKLGGGPCEPMGSDLKFVSPTGNVRYPDVTVDCGSGGADGQTSLDPRVVIEVLSPSNDWFWQSRLLDDYQAHPGVRHILFFDQEQPRGQHWRRTAQGTAQGWSREDFEGLEAAIRIAALDLDLTSEEVYRAVAFAEPPGSPLT